MIAAVVPMKPLACAKQRLAGDLSDADRMALVRIMLGEVLTTLRACGAIAHTFVVTADAAIAGCAANLGAKHIAEATPAGLNSAVSTAARYLDQRNIGTMLVLPGDVPLVTSVELGKLASLAQHQTVTVAPAHDHDGTNALLLSPPDAIAPAFGPGSFERHLTAAHTAGFEAVTCALDGLGRDIDTPEDLHVLAERTVERPEYGILRTALTTAIWKEPQTA